MHAIVSLFTTYLPYFVFVLTLLSSALILLAAFVGAATGRPT